MFFFSSFSTLSVAEENPTDVIRGSVINKTLNGNRAEGLEIILYQFIEDKTVEINRTKSDRTGSFAFQGINIDKKNIYYTSTRYKEVDYFSEMLPFQEDKELILDVIIYDTTNQDNGLHIKIHHILLERYNNAYRIQEIMVVENPGDRTYVGFHEIQPGTKETLRVSLPREAINVQSMDPFVMNLDGAFSNTAGIKPGTKRIVISYMINPKNPNYKFGKDINLETKKFNIIFPAEGIQVRSNGLEIKGPTENAGKLFYYLSGENLTKGSKIVVELSLSQAKNLFKWIIPGLVTILVATGFALPFIMRKYRKDETLWQTNIEELDLTEQRQALLQAIADMDDLFESGKINPKAYHTERAELITKVKELSKQLITDGHLNPNEKN
jgi:hypothetical protein